MTIRVLGLDLSMTATGIAFPNGNTSTVATNAKHRDARLVVIRDAVTLALTGVDLVVMEEAPPGLKGPAIKAIHMVQGAVRVALLDMGVPYAVVNPSTLKAYATGRKGADKTAMALAAFKRGVQEFPDDNQCDAWWLRLMGLDHFGLTPIAMPQAQRAFLDSVAWPTVPDPVEPVLISTLLDDGSPVRVGSSDPVPCHFEAR